MEKVLIEETCKLIRNCKDMDLVELIYRLLYKSERPFMEVTTELTNNNCSSFKY